MSHDLHRGSAKRGYTPDVHSTSTKTTATAAKVLGAVPLGVWVALVACAVCALGTGAACAFSGTHATAIRASSKPSQDEDAASDPSAIQNAAQMEPWSHQSDAVSAVLPDRGTDASEWAQSGAWEGVHF